jgi:tRNA dimethylallyltransferase
MKVIILLGPTAVGKSDVAVVLAKAMHGEVISADSSQVYKGLDIGSGKITKDEMQGVAHHLIDILTFKDEFNVALFKQHAENAIADILSRGKQPIICGGTMLYTKALVEGYNFFKATKMENLRQEYEQLAAQYGNKYVHDILAQKDPERALKINSNDLVRTIRALEILAQGGQEEFEKPKYEYVTFVLNKNREELYNRINRRVDKMVEKGLFEEVANLLGQGATKKSPCFKSIGYKEIVDFFEGNITKEQAIELVKQNSRNYAKRQLTWLRKVSNAHWVEHKDMQTTVHEILKIFAQEK